MSIYLTDEHVDLLNLILAINRETAQGSEFIISDDKRIVGEELSAYGDSNILIKFKIKVFYSDKEIIVEQKCTLTKSNLSEGKIGFSIIDTDHSKSILQIIQFLIERLEVMRANAKEDK